jgi:hypothetical protein
LNWRQLSHQIRWFIGDTLPRWGFEILDQVFATVSTWLDRNSSEGSVGPVVLLIPSAHHRKVRWRVLNWLTLEGSASSRMHGGLVVPATKQIFEVNQSTFVAGHGRRTERSTEGIRPGLEYQNLLAAIEALDGVVGYPRPTPRDLLRSSLEVIVFSSVPVRVWNRMRRSGFLQRRLSFMGTFDPGDALCRAYFWNNLPLYAAVGPGAWYELLQESPEFGWPPSDDGSFTVDADYIREPKRAILFSDFGSRVFFERGVQVSNFPDDLPPVASPNRTQGDPSSRALDVLGAEPTTRLSPRDDPSIRTRFVLAPIGLRYPDPMEILPKVELYCLARNQADAKWKGFASAGYELARGDDSHLLAASLASSLLFTPTLQDVRTTADGHLQFGVDIALPTRRGGYAPVTTSWLLSATKSPRLGTAFVSGSANRAALANTLKVPVGIYEDFAAVTDWIDSSSGDFARDRYSDGGAAFGWVWVRHDHARSAEFAAWLRRHRSASSSTFTRKRFGGKVTQWYLGGGDGESTDARLAFAQTALLLLDIRSHRELKWD